MNEVAIGYAFKLALGVLLGGLIFLIIVAIQYRNRVKGSADTLYIINKNLARNFRSVACGRVAPGAAASHRVKQCLVAVERNGKFDFEVRGNLSEESASKILLRQEN